jgi:hypothetical protein
MERVFAALQPGSSDRLPHFLFVAVHLRGVDVPIADTQRLAHRGTSLSRDDLEDSEAELRDRMTAVESEMGDRHLGR